MGEHDGLLALGHRRLDLGLQPLQLILVRSYTVVWGEHRLREVEANECRALVHRASVDW